ncbi:MAG: PepSY domain-containing protein [Acidobacteria bacterium]|nr:PepSY domain-containing protein [Acidobacteriota bacterium]
MPLPSESLRTANRRAHYYLGLYFLFFLWLFAFTGLLLNHSWAFAEFWPNRQVTQSTHPVARPASPDPLVRAHDLMRQLGLHGEVEWTAARAGSPAFSFRLVRPGQHWQVTLDESAARATVEHTRFNAWGVLRLLHTFTGVRANDARNQRDWLVTTLWAFAMDAVALGLIAMVLSGIYLWLCLPAKRLPGVLALAVTPPGAPISPAPVDPIESRRLFR